MYYSDYEGDGGELHYRLRKQRPDLKFQGGPYFSKLSVRADQNFQRKFPSGTKFFRTKIPVTCPVLYASYRHTTSLCYYYTRPFECIYNSITRAMFCERFNNEKCFVLKMLLTDGLTCNVLCQNQPPFVIC